jgi:hypothetical protein
MPDFNHCRQCGRELLNTIFCPQCEHCLCSYPCLDEHIAGHTVVDHSRALAANSNGLSEKAPPAGKAPRGEGLSLSHCAPV